MKIIYSINNLRQLNFAKFSIFHLTNNTVINTEIIFYLFGEKRNLIKRNIDSIYKYNNSFSYSFLMEKNKKINDILDKNPFLSKVTSVSELPIDNYIILDNDTIPLFGDCSPDTVFGEFFSNMNNKITRRYGWINNKQKKFFQENSNFDLDLLQKNTHGNGGVVFIKGIDNNKVKNILRQLFEERDILQAIDDEIFWSYYFTDQCSNDLDPKYNWTYSWGSEFAQRMIDSESKILHNMNYVDRDFINDFYSGAIFETDFDSVVNRIQKFLQPTNKINDSFYEDFLNFLMNIYKLYNNKIS